MEEGVSKSSQGSIGTGSGVAVNGSPLDSGISRSKVREIED